MNKAENAWGAFASVKDELINAPFGQQSLIKERLHPSISQLCQDYEIPESTLRYWINKSKLPSVTFDRLLRYERSEVVKLIKLNKKKRKEWNTK